MAAGDSDRHKLACDLPLHRVAEHIDDGPPHPSLVHGEKAPLQLLRLQQLDHVLYNLGVRRAKWISAQKPKPVGRPTLVAWRLYRDDWTLEHGQCRVVLRLAQVEANVVTQLQVRRL